MAGVSTPGLAAAVSDVVGLGSIGEGNLYAEQASEVVRAVQAISGSPMNVNDFCRTLAAPGA